MITLYGLKNCDTCRKARKWLVANSIEYRFHDIRADGLTREHIERWVEELGWEAVLNRRSTTWRGLPDSDRAELDDTSATTLMTEHPTLIKRPVFELGSSLCIGFGDDTKKAIKGVSG